MHKFVSPIINLIISENAEKFNICSPELARQHLNNNFVASVGTIELNRLLKNPVWLFLIDENIQNYGGILHQLNATQNGILSTGFWLQKDCAIMSPIAYIFNEIDTQQDIRNSYYSNSIGKYTPVEFSVGEIEQAFIKFQSLYGMFDQKKHEPAVVESGPIKSAFNSIRYNDFSLIERALQFIILARSTSHVPQKVSWYVVAIESLFGNNENTDITFKVSYRTAHFFDVVPEERDKIAETIKSAYGLRSKFLHGAKLDNKHKEDEDQEKISAHIDDILRRVFNIIINDENKRNILTNSKLFLPFFHKKLIGY